MMAKMYDATEFCDFSHELKDALCDFIDADFGLLEKLRADLKRQYESFVEYKSNQRNSKLMEYVHNIQKDHFFKALQATGQQHVVNYINQQQQRLDATDHKCFPLTKKQSAFLEENMFQLTEQIDIDPPFLHEIYAAKCITQKHFNHIREVLSQHDRVTWFLRILFKRSQVDYDNVSKALEKTGQDHVARLFIEGGGVLELHVELDGPDAATDEAQLVAQFKAWTARATTEERLEFLSILSEPGEISKLLTIRKSNSVSVFIHVTTLSALERLNRSREDGKLKSALEAVFSILLEGRRCEIRELEWTTANYDSCLNYFLRSGQSEEVAGQRRITSDSEMEVIPQEGFFEELSYRDQFIHNEMEKLNRTLAAELMTVRRDFENLRMVMEQLGHQQEKMAFKVENALFLGDYPMMSQSIGTSDRFGSELPVIQAHGYSGDRFSGKYKIVDEPQGYMEQPYGVDEEVRRRIFSGVDELIGRLKKADQKISRYEQGWRDMPSDYVVESMKNEVTVLNKRIEIQNEERDELRQRIATQELDISKLHLLLEDKERELCSMRTVAKVNNKEVNNLKNLLKLADRKLDERLEQLKKMQKTVSSVEHLTQGIVDVKVTETRQMEEVHTVAKHDSSRRATKVPGYLTRLQQLYQPMIKKLSAKPVAAELFQSDVLSLAELQTVHCSPTPTEAAECLLRSLLDKGSDVSYDCFLGALKATGQEHIYLWLTYDDFNIDGQHTKLIRRSYSLLRDHLNATDSGLLTLLFQKKVIDLREREFLEAGEGSAYKTERLLSVLSRKSVEQFEEFLIALDQTGQGRVADELRSCRRPPVDRPDTPTNPAAGAAVAAGSSTEYQGSPSRSMTSAITTVIAASKGRKGNVGGLTVHGNELFVVRSIPKGRIEVYGAENGSFMRDIKIKEFDDICSSGVHGMTSCDVNNCLYVCDSRYIVRVALTDGNEVFVWQVQEGGAQGLSVNSKSNLIVACGRPQRLIEYTTRGDVVRVIVLPERLKAPQHALEMTNGQLLVSHGYDETSKHDVCIVDADGRKILHSYGRGRGSLRLYESKLRLNKPKHLAVDKNGFIFVADSDNSRVLVLNSTLKLLNHLGCDVKKPCSLCIDDKRNLLFVGERNNDNSRVVVLTV